MRHVRIDGKIRCLAAGLAAALLLLGGAPSRAQSGPTLNVATAGLDATLAWSEVPGARSYRLLYDFATADGSFDGAFDVGVDFASSTTNVTYRLWDGADVYVMLRADTDGGPLDSAVQRVTIAAGGAVIVAVDGLSFNNTLVDLFLTNLFGDNPFLAEMLRGLFRDNFSSLTEHYLQQALQRMSLAGVAAADIRSFAWSRDAQESSAELLRLRTLLREAHAQARREGKKFIVVAHSWGTVLSHLAVAHEYLAGDFSCDLYVALSSPLGTPYVRASATDPLSIWEILVTLYTYQWLETLGVDWGSVGVTYPQGARWGYNLWATGDVISGPLPENAGLWNVQLDAGAASPRDTASTQYWHQYTSLQDGGLIVSIVEQLINASIAAR